MSKKQIIMEKALELFAKQGFEATSIQQITDYCGISKGAFYLSFKSKDELIIALIDQFMEAITSDIDHIVKTTKAEELLHSFYYAIFQSFQNHSDFAKVLIQEQTQSLNKDLLGKLRYYNRLFDEMILTMIERIYGEEIKNIKHDLMYCIKGFMSMYSELFLFNNVPLDIDLEQLSHSLEEKTNILAKYSKVPFISNELLQIIKQPTDREILKEELVEILEQKIEEIDDEPIIKESLILLKQHLLNPTLSKALVAGLLENIQKDPHSKWIAYLLRNFGI